MTEPSAARLRLVYVVHADPGNVPPAEVLHRWPTAPRTVSALAATGLYDVLAVARTKRSTTSVHHDGVDWLFVHDVSRIGWRVARAVRRAKPDVVHVNALLASLPTIVIRLLCGRSRRIVVQHHGEPPGSGRTLHAQRLARRLVDAYLFTGGTDQAEPWRAAGVLSSTTPVFDVLESSADLRPFDRASARQQTGMIGEPAIVWVGRLIPGKDPLTAIEAFANLGAQHDAHLWMIYADNTLESDVKARLDASPSLATRVHLVGRVPHDAMAAWFSSADIVLATSHSEGSGYALIEALACGCTPVVSDIAPHRTIVGSLGTRFSPGDAAEAASALQDVRVTGWEPVRADFQRRLSWDVVAAQLHNVYARGGTTTKGQIEAVSESPKVDRA
jgi:glycosyltransferase involved in cell wall biosynthesis